MGSQEPDRLGELIADARRAFAKVRDYSCTFIKQERVKDKLLPEQSAVLSVRQEPFSVHLRFTSPTAVMGQEVCYAPGRHEGKMRVRGNGLKAALGFITLPLEHPRVLAQGRHTIAEAGIGNLIERVAEIHAAWRGDAAPEIVEDEIDGRACLRVELFAPDGSDWYAHRVRICFDAETQLPIRFEAFDPPAPGEPDGVLLERYTYSRLVLNPGIPAAAFEK